MLHHPDDAASKAASPSSQTPQVTPADDDSLITNCCNEQEDVSCEEFLRMAKRYCRDHGKRLTQGRRLILQLVYKRHGLIKAYDVLNDLRAIRGKADAPTVYRALDFFVEQGLMHRVEGLNGYILCRHFNHQHESLLLCCRECQKIEEWPLSEGFEKAHLLCKNKHFLLETTLILLNGVCACCREREQDHEH